MSHVQASGLHSSDLQLRQHDMQLDLPTFQLHILMYNRALAAYREKGISNFASTITCTLHSACSSSNTNTL